MKKKQFKNDDKQKVREIKGTKVFEASGIAGRERRVVEMQIKEYGLKKEENFKPRELK